MASTAITPVDHTAWTWWWRALFRFAFLFWGQFCILQFGLLGQLLWFAPWINRYILRWPLQIAGWPVGRLENLLVLRVFHLSGEAATPHMTGSGDTALNWIAALSVLILTAVGTLIWTAIAEIGIARLGWRKEYRTLYAWLRLGVRFSLASILLSYGFSKVFDVQFSPLRPFELAETYGASSPMRLLWRFMGFSVPYTIFGGVAEVVPGMLLLFRRTMTVGALLASAVLLNIVMLNLCYDVPVKLYSSLYLLMALFLLLPDIVPILRFFFANRETRLRGVWLPPWERKSLRIAGYILQSLLAGHLLFSGITQGLAQHRSKVAAQAPPAVKANLAAGDFASIDGSWIVDSIEGWPAGKQWRTVRIGNLRYQSITFFEVTRTKDQVNFGEWADWNHQIHFLEHDDSVLKWSLLPDGKAVLQGTWLGKPAKLTMHPVDANPGTPASYPLTSRGFHWVQEYPH